MKRYIGLRTLKTGIAVCLSVIVSNTLGLEYPFFVCMTAIISMDKTLSLSIKMGKNRVFGTLLGASLGYVFHAVSPGNPLLCGIGIMCLIVILNRLNMSGAIGISGIVFSAMMVHLGDKSPFLYGMHRTLDSFVGASITLFVNLLILPYYNISKLEAKIEQFNLFLRQQQNIALNNVIDEDQMKQLQKDIEFNIDMYLQEIMSAKKKQEVLDLCAKYHLLKQASEQLLISMNTKEDDYVNQYHLDKMNQSLNQYDQLITIG